MGKSDLPDDLCEFLFAAKKIFKTFSNTLKASKETLIYHYTNDIGLKGIIESGQLRLTNIFNLNDPSELSHGLFLAKKILDSKAVNASQMETLVANLFKQSFGNDIREFERSSEINGFRTNTHFFTCSFSQDDNDLGQWRAYADNGRGYALGFDAEALARSFLCD